VLKHFKVGRRSIYRTQRAIALGHIEGAVSRGQRFFIQNVGERLCLKVKEWRNLVDGHCRPECLKLRHIAVKQNAYSHSYANAIVRWQSSSVERCASKPSNIVVTCRDDAAKDLTVGAKSLAYRTPPGVRLAPDMFQGS
jgi:hypothetical protein